MQGGGYDQGFHEIHMKSAGFHVKSVEIQRISCEIERPLARNCNPMFHWSVYRVGRRRVTRRDRPLVEKMTDQNQRVLLKKVGPLLPHLNQPIGGAHRRPPINSSFTKQQQEVALLP